MFTTLNQQGFQFVNYNLQVHRDPLKFVLIPSLQGLFFISHNPYLVGLSFVCLNPQLVGVSLVYNNPQLVRVSHCIYIHKTRVGFPQVYLHSNLALHYVSIKIFLHTLKSQKIFFAYPCTFVHSYICISCISTFALGCYKSSQKMF